MSSPVVLLYRRYLRQIRQLPHLYLRQFFRLKAEDDVRRVSGLSNPQKCMKRISKDIRRLHDAVHGDAKAFAHVLDLAYGRKGKLWWELMEPLTTNSKAPQSPPIISGVEKSRPPVYSPVLTALLTSQYSRTTKALSTKALQSPPALPPHASTDGKDAQLLGPFSKRREVNIRWRYFTQECKKVLPPLEIVATVDPTERESHATWHNFGFRSTGVCNEIQKLVGQYGLSPTPTRKQRGKEIGSPSPVQKRELESILHRGHPSRWVRRRYHNLLQRLPIMKFKDGSFSVDLLATGLAGRNNASTGRLPEIDIRSLKWYGGDRRNLR